MNCISDILQEFRNRKKEATFPTLTLLNDFLSSSNYLAASLRIKLALYPTGAIWTMTYCMKSSIGFVLCICGLTGAASGLFRSSFWQRWSLSVVETDPLILTTFMDSVWIGASPSKASIQRLIRGWNRIRRVNSPF
jgi:hypothetical protein